jgi:hypothetical protein
VYFENKNNVKLIKDERKINKKGKGKGKEKEKKKGKERKRKKGEKDR